MRKTMMFACVMTLAGLTAAPAFADCQAEIKAAEDAAMNATNAKQKADAEGHLRMAKDELAKGNEKSRSQHAAEASAALTAKPAAKSPY